MTRLLLMHPHTHAGRLYAPGERIEVDDRTAQWLLDQGVARRDVDRDAEIDADTTTNTRPKILPKLALPKIPLTKEPQA